jgi:hypothetical protein
MKGPGEERVKWRFIYIFQENIFKLWNHTYETRKRILKFILSGPHSCFQILFVLLKSTHFKAPDGGENENWIKMDLTLSFSGLFIF